MLLKTTKFVFVFDCSNAQAEHKPESDCTVATVLLKSHQSYAECRLPGCLPVKRSLKDIVKTERRYDEEVEQKQDLNV